MTTASILDDVFASLTLKRKLERGTADVSEAADFVVGRCAVADDTTVEAATRAAAEAAPQWARRPLSARMELGAGIRRRLRQRHAEFIDLLTAEGTPRALAEWQVAGLLEIFSEETLGWCAEQMEHRFEYDGRRMLLRRVPDGVVAVNPPQNAPASSALFGILPLLSGNAVVLRAPRSAPLGVMYAMRELVVPALDEVGAPPGTLNVFCARPGPVLRGWLDSPQINDIFYTGGVSRGLELERECLERGKKPILELAGNDCLLVWHDADLDAAAEAVSECFFGSGQICMVPNQVLVHPLVADELLERLRLTASLIRPGLPEDPGALLSPVLRSERFFEYVRDALAKGASVVHGARRLETDGTASDTGLFLEPTVLRIDGLANCRDIEAVREETFFPLMPVVVPEPAPDEDVLSAMIDYVNGNPYGLRNSLWTADQKVIDTFVTQVSNGGLLKVNDSHIGFLPYMPTHGGTGRTGGAFGEANYPMLRSTHLQGVSVAEGVRPREAVFGAYAALLKDGACDGDGAPGTADDPSATNR
ncbi:aldehyde dehydrogenase family protein [Streptomyces afghaniensis]|uniref:aldehyde dehydrogenase family protein n=1 Tax=Streptomyces afghaniensis TaxID=66865 RepID=UPI0027D7B210|nr:aldehyde dehydrogenase family protein [Streptomyces afghaniensis]